jgi:hypothetical protein
MNEKALGGLLCLIGFGGFVLCLFTLIFVHSVINFYGMFLMGGLFTLGFAMNQDCESEKSAPKDSKSPTTI